jgi:hypothetical protein
MKKMCTVMFLAVASAALFPLSGAQAAELAVQFPLGRTVYQTNETIPLAVRRSDPTALGESTLTATLTAEDNSTARFTLPVPAVVAAAGGARRTEFLNFNGALLRPGKYNLQK